MGTIQCSVVASLRQDLIRIVDKRIKSVVARDPKEKRSPKAA